MFPWILYLLGNVPLCLSRTRCWRLVEPSSEGSGRSTIVPTTWKIGSLSNRKWCLPVLHHQGSFCPWAVALSSATDLYAGDYIPTARPATKPTSRYTVEPRCTAANRSRCTTVTAHHRSPLLSREVHLQRPQRAPSPHSLKPWLRSSLRSAYGIQPYHVWNRSSSVTQPLRLTLLQKLLVSGRPVWRCCGGLTGHSKALRRPGWLVGWLSHYAF